MFDRLMWLMFVLMSIFIVMAYSPPVKAENAIWIGTTVRSYHTNREAYNNEHNYGISIEIPLEYNLRIVGGEYHNSLYKHTNYIGAAWFPLQVAPHAKVGVAVVGAGGYPVSPAYGVIPTLIYERGHIGFNVGTTGRVSAFQFKVGW